MLQDSLNGKFVIRRFLAEDTPQLIAAWKEAYPDLFDFKYPDRWRWNMLGNPFVPEEQRPLCWVAMKGDEIAAWTCAMAVPIDTAGQRVIGGHSVDTFTLERYRQYGLGKKLQTLNQSFHSVFIAIDPSAINRRNKYKVGGLPGKALDTWLRLETTLDSNVLYRSFLGLVVKYLGGAGESFFSKCGVLGLPWLLNQACSLALRLRQTSNPPKLPIADTDLTFETIASFSETSDLLWQRTKRTYSFAIARDSAYLNWKYVNQPNLDFHRVLVSRNGEPVGLLIFRFPVREEQMVGIISECFCLDDDTQLHTELVRYAMADFKRQGIDTIKCGASTDNQRKALRALGFGLVDIDVPVFHISPEASDLDLTLIMAKDWLLSIGDSDLDQIRPVQQPGFVEIVRIISGTVPGAEHLSK